MSINTPPNPNVATFNNLYWISADSSLTQSQADLRYLKFPVAQGTENLQTTNVNGTLTTNSNIVAYEPLTMSGALNTDRIINNVYYQLQDANSLATTTGQIYAGSGIINYDNDIVNGSHNFATNDSGNIQTIPLTFSSANMTIASTNLSVTGKVNSNLTFNANADIIQESGSQLLQQPASTSYSTTDNVLNGTEIRTTYGQSQNTSLRISDAASLKGIFFLPYATDNVYDNIVQAGDAVITSSAASLVLTNSSSNNNTTNGIRLDNTQVLVGFGDGNDIPTNNISFTQSATTISGVAPDCAASSALATSDNSTKLPSTAWVRSYVTSIVPATPVTLTSTPFGSGYNSGGNYTYWYFSTYPTWAAYSWVFSTPTASRSNVNKTNLGSTPPMNVGTIGANGSYLFMTGNGISQGYTATSSTMITYCGGFQQQYTISAGATAAILSVINCIGGTPAAPVFQSNQLSENSGPCPPVANGLSGYIILQILNGNYTGLGTPTLTFTQIIA